MTSGAHVGVIEQALLLIAVLTLIPVVGLLIFVLLVVTDWLEEFLKSDRRSFGQVLYDRFEPVRSTFFTWRGIRSWLIPLLVLGGFFALMLYYGISIYEPKEGDPCPPPLGVREETVLVNGRWETVYFDDNGNRFVCK